MVADTGIFIEHLRAKDKEKDVIAITENFTVLPFTDAVAQKAAELYH